MLFAHIKTKQSKFVDLAWPCRDKKTSIFNLEEELMMKIWRVLKKNKKKLSPPHFSFDYKTVAQ